MVLIEASNDSQWPDKDTHILIISVIFSKIKSIGGSGGPKHAATCNSSEYSKVIWTSKFDSLVTYRYTVGVHGRGSTSIFMIMNIISK